jgi:hypothetical protein
MECGTKWHGSLIAALIFGVACGAYAQDTAWQTAASGSWTNGANWNNGVPNGNAAFLTNTAASYTATFDGGAGNSITNVVISNASVGNTTTLSVNSGVLNITGSQGAGGTDVGSNAVLSVVGGSVNNPSVFSVTQGGVIIISNSVQSSLSLYDNFESYTNGEVIATGSTPVVSGSPWGRFGAATADNPVVFSGIGVGGSQGAQYPLDWSLGNNGQLVYYFSTTPTNLQSTVAISVALAVSNVTGLVSNTVVEVAVAETNGAVYETTASFAQLLTNTAYQTFTLALNASEMVNQGTSGPFDLTQVQDVRLRFYNAGGAGTELILVDNFQGSNSTVSTWNQSAGNFSLGEVGNGTVVIGPGGIMAGPAIVPTIGYNDATIIIPGPSAAASNAVGHLFIEGGNFAWPGHSSQAFPMEIGRGQIGIVTVSNGWFEITSGVTTSGVRVGYTSSTCLSTGRGTVEMFGGVVTNTGYLEVGAGQGTSSAFGVGSITVSGGAFNQLGMGPAGAIVSVTLPNSSYDSGFLTVNGSGTFFSTNTIIVGNAAQSTGLIQVSGSGQLIVTNVPSYPGLILLGVGGTGTLDLSGGLTVADRLVATSGVNSVVNFASGQLEVNVQMVVSNGAAFTVGNGTSAATLDFMGGTHWFGNGLNISGNAALTGVGTINAAVTLANNAVWAPGGPAGGTQTVVGAVVLNPTTILDYQFGAPGGPADLVNITGNLTLAGTLDVTNLGGFTNGTYTVFTYTGTLVNNTLNVGTLPGSLSGTISNDTVNKLVLLIVSSTPPNPFVTWQDQYFTVPELGTPSFSGPNADPLGKGMSNTNQFMAGFNPTNAAAYLHIISIAKTNNNADIKVTYLGANGDSTYNGGPASRTNVLEFMTGTANGSYTNPPVWSTTGQSNILNAANGLGTVTNMVDVGGATNKPSRYYRVRVLLP